VSFPKTFKKQKLPSIKPGSWIVKFYEPNFPDLGNFEGELPVLCAPGVETYVKH
jgi:hypothetical protein